MIHVFKVPLRMADLFISNLTETEITYEVRDKDEGKLMEPRRTTKYQINEQDRMAHFDNRFIPIQQLQLIYETLK